MEAYWIEVWGKWYRWTGKDGVIEYLNVIGLYGEGRINRGYRDGATGA